MLNFSSASGTHFNVKMELEGTTYVIEHFRITFDQKVDYKGQPQSEVKGGRINIDLAQSVAAPLYEWAKSGTSLKSGTIAFFSEQQGTFFEIIFTDAYCTRLRRSINEYSGTNVNIEISPRLLSLNGIQHNNEWRR